jgi:plasmid stabilization system protein ParE
MTWAVAWRPLAERDLIDCAAHIAQDNIEVALRFVDAVEETVASLAENPMLSRNPLRTPRPGRYPSSSCERVQALSDLLP